MAKKCTLALGRSIYVRKQVEGITLKAADNILKSLATEFRDKLRPLMPDGISLVGPSEARLIGHSIAETAVHAVNKDGVHVPTHLWLRKETIRELEKDYRIS